MAEYTQDWFTGLIKPWSEMLKPYVGKKTRFLEVGCFEGRASVWLLENILTNPESHITCIDTFEGGADHKESKIDFPAVEKRFKSNISPFKQKVMLLKGKSIDRLSDLITENKKFDICYIDGSHVAKDVIVDAVLCFRLVKPGGLLIFDDYEWTVAESMIDRPKTAIDFFRMTHMREIETVAKGYQIVFRKVQHER